MKVRGLLLALGICASAAAGQTPTAEDRPQARPDVAVTRAVGLPLSIPSFSEVRPRLRPASLSAYQPRLAAPRADLRPTLRPYLRPDLARGATTRPQVRADRWVWAHSPFAVAFSYRPLLRPERIPREAEERAMARRRGQVCGDPAIQGDTLGVVSGRGACGIDSGVRVRSIAGVALNPSATMDCRTAQALKTWITRGAQPAVVSEGGGLASLRVVSHYACRFRNSASSGRLSEHAFGRAIDIAGIGLRNGQEISVLRDWGRGDRGRALRSMWQSACGPFGTVLGPEANAAHRDHFHFDTARYRSGSYCR